MRWMLGEERFDQMPEMVREKWLGHRSTLLSQARPGRVFSIVIIRKAGDDKQVMLGALRV
jgi:hypothetical protein